MKSLAVVVAGLPALVSAATAAFPVCIVGAGPAGLSAANQLESQGYQTITFEKQTAVGGKCQAVYDSNTFHPLGALLYTNTTYRETIKIIDQVDVPSIPFHNGTPAYVYDWQSGAIAPVPAATTEFKILLIAEIARYAAYWALEFGPLYSEPNYHHGVPEQWTVSTKQWLANHDYYALPVLFNGGMVAYGYGDMSQVPILYMLQYFTPDIVLAFADIDPGYIIDFHAVWTQFAAQHIKGPINLNATISNIDRSGALPAITYSVAGAAPQTQTCASLLLAFPPTIPALQAAHLDVTPDETTVFSPVGIINYSAGAVRMKITPQALFAANSSSPSTPPDAAGEPVAFIQLDTASDVATTWSWGAYRTVETQAEALQLLISTLSKVNRNPTVSTSTNTPITAADVLGFRKTDYFPHFDSAQLSAGWYGKLKALQGTKNTYYASGLNGFETVEFAVRAGLSIVSLYF